MFGVPIPAMQVSEIERGVINAVHRIKDAPVTGSQPFALDQSVGSEPLDLDEHHQDKGVQLTQQTRGSLRNAARWLEEMARRWWSTATHHSPG